MISVVKKKFGYDDALDAFGCHGIGGMFGGIMTGIFATPALAPEKGYVGLVYGSENYFWLILLRLFLQLFLRLLSVGLLLR